MSEVGTTYTLDVSQAIAALSRAGEADDRLRQKVRETGEAMSQAFQQAAKHATVTAQQVAQQAEKARVTQEAYKILTAELGKQEKAEKALNAERDKGNASAKRVEEIKQALQANQQQQKQLKEEIERTTLAMQEQAKAAQAAATVTPAEAVRNALPAPAGSPAAAPAGDSRSLVAGQQQAKAALDATTAAVQDQAQAQQQLGGATADTVAQYRAVGEAAKAAEEAAAAQLAESVQREQQARDSRAADLAQLKQLKEEEKALRTERNQTAPGVARNDLQLQINANTKAQREYNSYLEAGSQAVERETQLQAQLTEEIKQAAAAQKQAARDATAAEKRITQEARVAAAAERDKQRAAAATAKEQDKQARAAGILGGLEKQLLDLTQRRAKALSTGEAQGYTKQIESVKGQIKSLTSSTAESSLAVRGLSAGFAAAGGLLAGTFTVDKAIEFAKNVVSTRAEFERLELVLTNNFSGNNNKAKRALYEVATFAKQTGQNVSDVTETYVKLINRGIEPTQKQLLQLSDIALASNKSTDQFIEALLDAQQGEFMRLREFGIKAKVSGDQVAFSFKGVTTEVKNTSQAISDYLFGIGNLQGVSGATALMAEKTDGALARLKGSFTLLFDTIGRGTNGPLTSFVNLLSRATDKVTDAFKSNNQKIQEAASQGIPEFGQQLDKQFSEAIEKATQKGQDANAALRTIYNQQMLALQEQLAKEARLQERVLANPFEDTADGKYVKQTFYQGDVLGNPEGAEKQAAAQNAVEARILRLQQEQDLLLERFSKVQVGYRKEADQLGVIAELEAKIKKEREALQALPAGPDFEPQRAAAVKQIKEDEALLAAYYGKENKALTTQLNEREAALKRLLAAERKLRADHDRAVLESLKDEGQARAAEQLRQDFNELAQAEKQIKQLEAEYAKKGGRGVNADGQLNSEQQQELDNARYLAVEKFNEEMARINRVNTARSLELQKDSDAKELAQLRAKFAEEIRVAQQSNEALGQSIERAYGNGNQTLALSLASSKFVSDQLLTDLKAAADEQERLLLRQQKLAAIDRTEKGQIDSINAGQIPIRQVLDVTADGSGAAQEGAAKRQSVLRQLYEKLTTLEVDLEKKKQKAVLQAQVDGNNERLLEYQNDFSETGITITKALTDLNKQLLNDFNKIKEPEGRKFDLMKLLGVAPEDRDEVQAALDNAVSQSIQAVNQILEAQMAASQAKIDAKTREIDELQRDLDRELQYAKEGSASNIANTRAEIAEAKAARREALADQKKIAKQQQLVQDLTAVSSISLAVANIIAGWSEIPLVGSIAGIVAAAAMVASFVSVKSRAKSAAQSSSEGFFRGGYTGGQDKREERGVVHGKEFVHTADVTDKYRYPLFEALHKGRPDMVDWTAPSMRDLIPSFEKPEMQPLLPDYTLPGKLKQERQEAARLEVSHQFAPMQAEFQALQAELAEIKKHTMITAKRPLLLPESKDYTLLDPETGSTKHRKTRESL